MAAPNFNMSYETWLELHISTSEAGVSSLALNHSESPVTPRYTSLGSGASGHHRSWTKSRPGARPHWYAP